MGKNYSLKKKMRFIKERVIKTTLLLLILFAVLFLGSCNFNNNNEILVNISMPLPIPEIIIDHIAFLETNDQSLIGEIHRIEYFKDRIIILDLRVSRNIFVFDSKGSFISALQKGRGPAEVMYPTEFFIDKAREHIIVYDYNDKSLKTYDINLNFIKHESHLDLNIRNALLLNSDTLLVNWPAYADGDKMDKFLLYHLYSISGKQYLRSFMPIDADLISIIPEYPISISDEKVLFSKTFDNSIYSLELEDLFAKPDIEYQFSFGDLTIQPSDMAQGYMSVFQASWLGKKIVPFHGISKQDGFFSFNFSLYKKDNFIIYSKQSGSTYYSENLFQGGLIPECKLNGSVGNGQFLAFANPIMVSQFLFENQKYKIFEVNSQFDSFSNPCIMLFTLIE